MYYNGKQASDSIAVMAWQLTYSVIEEMTLAQERTLLDLLHPWQGCRINTTQQLL